MDGESQISRTLFRWQRRIPPPVRYVWLVTIYLVTWAALDKVSLAFETTPEVQIWYPPSALDIVLTLVFGLRYTPALWLNTLVHQYVVTHRQLNFVTLLLFDFVTTLGYAGASALLLYKLRINPRLRSLRDVIWFIVVAALAAPLVVAWLQVMNFAWSGLIPWSKWLIYTLHYWAGDATGIAMLAPVLLILLRQLPWVWLHPHEPPATRAHWRWPKVGEVPLLLAQSVALVLGIWVGYGVPRGEHLDYTYFVLLPLILIALRHGFERAAVTVLFINVAVALLVSSKFGQSNILALQFGLMAISHTGLFLGAVTTERSQAEKALRDYAQRMKYNAFHDVLTGLPNRALFMNHLGRAVEHGKRYQDYLFAVLFLDLDRFKVINDSLGHRLGDQLLIATARRLESCLRPTDTIARLGGDEFIILLENLSDISDTIRVAERIQTELKLPFELGGQEVFTTTSIGIALSATGHSQPSDLLRDADTAMYQAKVLGARYEIFNTSMHEKTVARLQMETDLRRAIERMEFLIYYQPLVSLITGRVTGFEALVRWQHPQRGLLSPAKFVLVAEETGLLSLIDQWVMREACRQTQQWSEQMPLDLPLSISVNLANKHFTQPNLIEQISQILHETSLDASRLKLEITENVIMEIDQTATATLSQLKALGIRLAIDDFGTGYSSLSRLHRFPIDELKIDRSFVSKIGADKDNLEITETILTLAQKLGVDVTAEGIETTSQLAQLRDLKCTYGQGYFFSRPLSSQAAEALIIASPQW
jgi:diguanylate cyclase (GGDEF)-like protein